MRTAKYILLLTAVLSVAAAADEIGQGDSTERVRQVLGEPKGYIRSGDKEMMLFDRGTVIVRGGEVTEASILSEEEAAEKRRQRRIRHARAVAEQRERRKSLIEEGREIRESKLNDPSFLASPPGKQLEFWKSFGRKYPDDFFRAF